MRNFEVRHTKKKLRRFVRRHWLWLLIGAAALVVVLVVVLGVAPSIAEKRVQEQAEAVASGDEGADGTVATPAPRSVKMGVTALKTTGIAKGAIAGLEHAAAEDVKGGVLEAFDVRDARGDQNQQIQDIYAMINNGMSVLVVADSDAYNFGKIAEICADNDVQVVALDAAADSGFAVNVKTTADPAADFAALMKANGMNETTVLRGTPGQLQEIGNVVGVAAHYNEPWDAMEAIFVSIEGGNPLQSMVVLDYNANDTLRTWLKAETAPKAFAGIGTVAYIKTWYQLLNGGVEVVVREAEEADGEDETILASASADEFKGCASTAPENAGDVLYAFALGLAQGKTLPGENYVYEIAGYDIITNDNLSEYYEKVKDLDAGLVYSPVETGDITALFEES